MSEATISLISLAIHKGVSAVVVYKAQHNDRFSFFTTTFVGELLKLSISYIVLAFLQTKKLPNFEYNAIPQNASQMPLEKSVDIEEFAETQAPLSEDNSNISKRKIMLAIVSALYVVQNNAFLYASALLRPTILQAVWQLRIIATAAASTLILKRHFSAKQICSMITLILSVVLINQGLTVPSAETRSSYTLSFAGLTAILLACILSGLAGVLSEAILKDENTNMWTVNYELSLLSLIPSLGFMIYEIFSSTKNDVYGFTGFDGFWAWTVVFVHGGAGLLVAFATKYASSIAKTFSSAFAIIITLLLSWFAGTRTGPLLPSGKQLLNLVLGIIILFASTWMYKQGNSRSEEIPVIKADENA